MSLLAPILGRSAKRQLSELTESVFTEIPEGAIDREGGVIRGVRIFNRFSKRGREYSPAALQEAAGQYEGVGVYLDHMPAGRNGEVRSIKDSWGVLRNVKVKGDGAVGDLHYLKEHNETPVILERAERGVPMGLSHNARGKVAKINGREVVESVPVVFSVDLVSRPATTSNLFESEANLVTTNLRELIEATKYEHTAALLEMLPDEVDPMAAVEMEAPEEPEKADPVEAVKSALADEAVKIFLDPAIDPTETGKKIKDLAKAAEDVANKVNPAEASADDEPADDAEEDDEEKGVPESLMKQIDKRFAELTESIEPMRRKDAARDFLDARNLTMRQVGAERFQKLQECKDEKAMVALAESWPPVLRGAKPPVIGSNASGTPRKVPRLINARRG